MQSYEPGFGENMLRKTNEDEDNFPLGKDCCPSCGDTVRTYCRVELFLHDRRGYGDINHCCEKCFKRIETFLKRWVNRRHRDGGKLTFLDGKKRKRKTRKRRSRNNDAWFPRSNFYDIDPEDM